MQFNNGTITITPNSNVIAGVGTTFTMDAVAGDFIYVPGFSQVFQVSQVVTDTQLLIAQPVVNGANAISTLSYVIVATGDFTPVLGMPMPTAHQLSVQTQAVNRATWILDREIPSSY